MAFHVSIIIYGLLSGSAESNLKEAINETLLRIEQAEDKSIPFFVVNFHDYYFSNSYPIFFDYFKWLIIHLIENDYEFISFDHAVCELNS